MTVVGEAHIVGGEATDIVDHVESLLRGARASHALPAITLTYAQSIDGCIASGVGKSTALSGGASLALTHRLRAMHHAILVGVNTVLVDDPRLTVRPNPGTQPVPVVVDSRLRIPLGCRLLQRDDVTPIIATTDAADPDKAARLVDVGADVLRLPSELDGRVDLSALFARLAERGLRSVMVEGGACIITSVLLRRLASQVVLTISPRFLGGVQSVQSLACVTVDGRPRLTNVHYQLVGDDLVVQGELA